MIDFRYHLVSLTAVLLALAVGVTLGAGPLRGGVTEVLDAQDLQARVDTLQTQRDAGTAVAARLDESVARLAAPQAEGALSGFRVLVVQLPGAEDTEVAALSNAIIAAGSQVTATMTLTEAWTDPEQVSFRSALAEQVEPLLADVDIVPAGDGDVAALAAALAVALVDSEEAVVPAGVVGTVLGVLVGGELAALEPEQPAAAQLVLVVAGDDVDPGAAEGWVAVLAGLAARGPVVLVDDAPSATTVSADDDTRPLVVAVRDAVAEDPSAPVSAVSTVDHVGSVTGPVAAVLALAGAAAGERGDYGLLQDAAGPVPVRR